MSSPIVAILIVVIPALVVFAVTKRFGHTPGLILLIVVASWTVLTLIGLSSMLSAFFTAPEPSAYVVPDQTASPLIWFFLGAISAPLTALLLATIGFFFGKKSHARREAVL